MNITVTFASDSEGKIKTNAKDGGAPPDFDRVDIEPFFYHPTSSPTILHVRSFDSTGKVVSQVALKVSGSTGKISISDRMRRVRPKLDVEAQAQKKVAPTK